MKLPLEKVLDGEVVAALEKLSENSDNFTNLRILYYCSAVSEDPLPTTVDDLIRQITAFPSKMAQIDHGIPIEVTFLHHLALCLRALRQSFQYIFEFNTRST